MWWLLVIPFILVAVVVLLVLTLATLVAALANAWPLLLVALGIWMLVRGDRRHRARKGHGRAAVSTSHPPERVWEGDWRPAGRERGRHARTPAPGPQPAHVVASRPSAPTSGRAPVQLRRLELPLDVTIKVDQIQRKVDALLAYADRFPPFSQDLYIVRQTAGDYLPRTISTYLSLPAGAEDRPIPSTGKTAQQELREQVSLLDSKLDEIAQDLHRQDTERLLANRRFLEERFGTTASA